MYPLVVVVRWLFYNRFDNYYNKHGRILVQFIFFFCLVAKKIEFFKQIVLRQPNNSVRPLRRPDHTYTYTSTATTCYY